MKNEVIIKNGKPHWKAKVVMLPTEKADYTSLIKNNDEPNKMGLFWGHNRNPNSYFTQDYLTSANAKSYHLYFLSEEKIKDGDWYLDLVTLLIYKAEKRPVTMDCFKKIIISTNEQLGLSRPSNEFLSAYFRSNGEIKEVLIELQEELKTDFSGEAGGGAIGYKLKISPDNTITTKKIGEDTYKAEEMFLNMQYYMEYCERNGYVTPQDWLNNHKHF